MIEDIEKYVAILCELNITEHQFLILWLVFHKDEKNIAKYKSYKKFNLDEIRELIEKDLLNDFGIIKDGERNFNIYDFLVTDRFISKVVIDRDDAIEELVSAYPSWFNIGGKKIPAKNFDFDKLGAVYFAYHKGSRIKHQKVVAITKDYHEKITGGWAQKKIEDYLAGKLWILYEEELGSKGNADISNQVY